MQALSDTSMASTPLASSAISPSGSARPLPLAWWPLASAGASPLTLLLSEGVAWPVTLATFSFFFSARFFLASLTCPPDKQAQHQRRQAGGQASVAFEVQGCLRASAEAGG